MVLALEENRDASVSVARIAELAGVGRGAAAVLAHRLAGKGWLERVAKGTYALVPASYGPEKTGEANALALASLVHRPSYVGWWAAASFHGYTTQVPATIHVAVPKQAPPRVVAGSEVRFAKVAARKFFGAARFEAFGREAWISDPAKTLLDCVDRPDLCGGAPEVARIAWGGGASVDPAELVACAERFGSAAAAQRLGCLLDIVGRPLAGEARGRLRATVPRSQRSTIGRREGRPGDIGYVAEWGVRVNAAADRLLGDVPMERARGAGLASDGTPPC